MVNNFLNAENRYLSADVPYLYCYGYKDRYMGKCEYMVLKTAKNGGEQVGKRVKRKANKVL